MDEHRRHLMSCPSVPKLPYCPVCGKAGPTTEHHLVPRADGGHDGPTIFLCGHGTAGCHGKAEDKRLHFNYYSEHSCLSAWYWVETPSPTKGGDIVWSDEEAALVPQSEPSLVVIKSEFDQSIPFDEGTPDEGDAIHECRSRLTQAAQTASTLDYVTGSILNELAPLVTTEELYDAVEEAFGIARSTTPSFISRRRKYASKLSEDYADLGLSKAMALLDAMEKLDRPYEYFEADIRALTVSDFKLKHGLKKEPAERHACPDCGAVHACKHKEEK